MGSPAAVAVISALPVPMGAVRSWLRWDNERENRLDSWDRLRAAEEAVRYVAVRAMTERYATDGFVLDIGCSQGILLEGLTYRHYLGVDSFAPSIARAAAKADARTAFLLADGATFRPDQAPDVVVLNEVLYYLPDPARTVDHYLAQLKPGGVVIISIYARAWSSRRLLRQLSERHDVVESEHVESGHLAWTVVAYRARG